MNCKNECEDGIVKLNVGKNEHEDGIVKINVGKNEREDATGKNNIAEVAVDVGKIVFYSGKIAVIFGKINFDVADITQGYLCHKQRFIQIE